MMRLIILLLFLFTYQFSIAQKQKPTLIKPTSLEERKQAATQKENLRKNSILKEYPVRNIGPTVMGGRIVDVEASRQDFKKFYVAYASGGVYKTSNNALSFEPIFDNQARLTIGDIALSPANENVIWVGTGENNSSRSSYAGFGVYKSEDAGKTWTHTGLENTQHIGRIVAHPTDANTAWVASIGALYSNNADRGVYKTSDGGKSWKKTLFINDSTGVIDLVVHPTNPNLLWAATWERSRKSWDFKENGAGSGLYHSTDGGETWQKITIGLPESKWMGRIGLDICQSSPNVLYLIVDNQEETKKEKEPEEDDKLKIKFKDLETMTKEVFLNLNEADLDSFLVKKGFPKKYSARKVKDEIRNNQYSPKALSQYFESANDDLFETEVKGAEVYRSDDTGKSWRKVNGYPLEGIYYTYGYYFGQIRVSPDNAEQIYVFGVPFIRSDDGGKTFKVSAPTRTVHADHHALWIDPKDGNRVILGNDGGLYLSYDRGERYQHIANVPAGQFYTVAVDMERPYNVYGGLQDNGVYFGSSQSRPNESKDWESIMGGDGMFVQVNPKNNKIIYTGFQFGNHYRLENGRNTRITPTHDIGEPALRFNWRSPVLISKHNPDVVYFCANKVFRSLDKGDTWEKISGDLTKNKPQGNVPFSTISSFAESPLKFGLLYVGSDDGNLYISKNGGANWDLISTNLPQDRWISSIFPSTHAENTVFVSLTGYRMDELTTYIYKSTDFGKTWTSLKGNLPHEAVNVIIQDAVNPDLLYVGTDEGAYLSMNSGAEWHCITGDYPNVATYDMLVHPRDNELVLATHGRSMYVMDVKPLQKMMGENSRKPLLAFKPNTIRFNANWGENKIKYLKANEPEANILYFLANESTDLKIQVQDREGNTLQTLQGNPAKGFHQLKWNLRTSKGDYLKQGKYTIVFTSAKATESVELEVK